MARSPLLYLAPDGLHSYIQDKRTAEHHCHFPPDATGLEAFADWLSGFRAGTPFTLMADLPDERFRIETLPHVRGPDRKRLRERRQAQIFPDTPYVAHQYLDPEAGRKDDRLLFIALNRPSAITPWLDAIEHNDHNLTRLIPAPILVAALTRHLPPTSGPFLLALLTPAGLRVSYLNGGKLLFSRLNTHAASAAATPVPWTDEAQEIHRHLLSQRILTHNTPCTCYLLRPLANTGGSVPEAFPPHADLHFVQLDPALLFGGVRSAPDGETCLPLLLHLLRKHPRLPEATPAKAMQSRQFQQISLACKASAAAIFIACTALSVINVLAARDFEQQLTAAKTHADASEQALTALMANQPPSRYSLPQLQITLNTLRDLESKKVEPESTLHQLATALAPIPDVALRRIDWVSSSTNGQQLILHFALRQDSARQRVSQTQRILAALNTIPGVRLRPEHLPVEMVADRPLSPRILDAENTAPNLVIRLELPVLAP